MAGKIIGKGQVAPNFCLKDGDGKEACLKDFAGKRIVLYFYPKDDTPGCTIEANEFTKSQKEFAGLGCVVIGISPDSCQSHSRFSGKYGLAVTLLSDESHSALEKYGAWQLKKNYGKEYMGVVRTTYLIGKDGKVEEVWENVKAEGHAEKVLERVKSKF